MDRFQFPFVSLAQSLGLRLWLPRLCSFLALSLGSRASAYPTPVDFGHVLLRWPVSAAQPTVSYELKAETAWDYDEYYPTVALAFELWSGVSGSRLRFVEAESGQSPQVTVFLRARLPEASFAAGYAEFDQVASHGGPKHCSMYILTPAWGLDAAVAKTILHEAGHCAGLGHSLIPEAVMSYRLDANDFALDLDDEAAIARLYPAQGEPQLPPGCAVGREPAPLPAGSRLLLLALAFLPLLCSRLCGCFFWGGGKGRANPPQKRFFSG